MQLFLYAIIYCKLYPALVDDSSALGAAVGGTVGGIVFLLIAIAVLLLIIVWMKGNLQLHNKKSSEGTVVV